MVLWTDDTGDASGASSKSQEGVMDGVIQSFPSPRMVLQHSTVDSGESLFFSVLPTQDGDGVTDHSSWCT